MKIESIAYVLPPKELTSQQIVRDCHADLALPLERMTGIKSRRIAGDGIYAMDLAESAIADCLAMSDYKPEDIDLIISANICRSDSDNTVSFEPSTAIQLKYKLGFTAAIAFDISNACAGVFTALDIAQQYLNAGLAEKILIVSGEYISHLTNTAQNEIEDLRDERLACLTLGDSGLAMIVEASDSKSDSFQFLELETAAEHADLCTAMANPLPSKGAIMYTSSAKLAYEATELSIAHIKQQLEEKSIEVASLDFLIIHQTSAMAIQHGMMSLNRILSASQFNEENTINNLLHRGNTSTTTHLIAMIDSVISGKIVEDSCILFSINASGICYGTAVFQIGNLAQKILEFNSLQKPELC